MLWLLQLHSLENSGSSIEAEVGGLAVLDLQPRHLVFDARALQGSALRCRRRTVDSRHTQTPRMSCTRQRVRSVKD